MVAVGSYVSDEPAARAGSGYWWFGLPFLRDEWLCVGNYGCLYGWVC